MTAETTAPQASPSSTPNPSPEPTQPNPRPAATGPGITVLPPKGRGIPLLKRSPGPESSDPAGDASAGPADPLAADQPPTSTPSGSADTQPLKFGRDELRKLGRGLVAQITQGLHLNLVRDPIEQDAGLYLSTEEEQSGIGDPLADIVNRHLGIDASPDTVDLIKSGVVVLIWGLRQAQMKFSIARAKRRFAAANPGATVEPEATQ